MQKSVVFACCLVLFWAIVQIPSTQGQIESSTTPENVSDSVVALVAARVTELETRWQALDDNCDRQAVFPLALLISTRRVKNAIDQNDFNNGTQIAQVVIDMISAYSRSFDNWKNNRSQFVSKPWRKAFKWLESNDSSVLQDLFLGTNALINFDLAFILNDTNFCCSEDNKDDFKRLRDIMSDVQINIAKEFCLRYDPSLCLINEFTLQVINPSELHFIHRWFNVAWNEAEEFQATNSTAIRTGLIRDYERQASNAANAFIEEPEVGFDREEYCEMKKAEEKTSSSSSSA